MARITKWVMKKSIRLVKGNKVISGPYKKDSHVPLLRRKILPHTALLPKIKSGLAVSKARLFGSLPTSLPPKKVIKLRLENMHYVTG